VNNNTLFKKVNDIFLEHLLLKSMEMLAISITVANTELAVTQKTRKNTTNNFANFQIVLWNFIHC
jgi:hypothetical protein